MSLCELLQVPFNLEDPDYKGLELDVMSPCEKHGMASERLVAFEGTDTGRRFLACAQPVWIVGIVIFFSYFVSAILNSVCWSTLLAVNILVHSGIRVAYLGQA